MTKGLLIALLIVQLFSAWQLYQIRKYDNAKFFYFGAEIPELEKIRIDLEKSLRSNGWGPRTMSTVSNA